MDCSYLSKNTVLLAINGEKFSDYCKRETVGHNSQLQTNPFPTTELVSLINFERWIQDDMQSVLSYFNDAIIKTKEDAIEIAKKIDVQLQKLSQNLLNHFKRKDFHLLLQDTNISPWLNNFSLDILRTISHLAASYPFGVMTNVLVQLFSVLLERFLRDLFPYLTKKNSSVCPLLFTDVIRVPEIQRFFGQDITTLISFAVGPPFTLNLRNLAWHGFLLMKEIPDRYVMLLVIIWLLISSKCRQAQLKLLKSTCQVKVINSQIFRMPNANNVFDISIDLTFKVLNSNCFIPLAMLPQWTTAASMFYDERYFEVIVILLPQLEHALRCLFACVNDMPQCIVTAEDKTLFTTLDEIFARVLPSGQPNNLFTTLPKPLSLALLDLFMYRSGPRLRDFTSHGEISPSLLDVKIAHHLLNICLCLCTEFLYPWRQYLTTVTPLRDIRMSLLSYKPFNHPGSPVATTLQISINLLKEWNNSLDEVEIAEVQQCGNDNVNHVSYADHVKGYILYRGRDIMPKIVELSIQLLNSECDVKELIQTLYDVDGFPYLEVFSKDSTITFNLLLRILETANEAFEQIFVTISAKTQLFISKKMRSRNRVNYIALIERLPFFKSFHTLIVAMVAIEMSCLASLQVYNTASWSILKKALQTVENLKSHSSPSQNQWHSCYDVIRKFLDQLTLLFGNSMSDKVV